MKHPFLSGFLTVILATAIGYSCISRGMATANQEIIHDRTVQVNLPNTAKVVPGWDNTKSITK